MANSRGYVAVVVVVIIVVGLAVGGLFYFLGSENGEHTPSPLPVVQQMQSPTPTPSGEEVSESQDMGVIERELEGTRLDSIDQDLEDVADVADSF
jgi:hypothetical protein